MTRVEFKQKCIELRKKDLSIYEIAEILNRPKTSIYFHVKKLPLSAKRLALAKKLQTDRIVKYSLSKKGKSALGRHPKNFVNWTPQLVNLVGHLIFDGEISRGSCVYTNRNKSLLNKVSRFMQEVYKFKPVLIESTPDVYRISYHNIELTNMMREKARELLGKIISMPETYQRELLKAFFDDEGCIYWRKNKRAIRGYQHNVKLLNLIKKLLNNFEIEGKVDEKYKEIVIGRKENLLKFRDEINFSPGVRINGKRSNSIWKQHVEKRELLARAIATYKPTGSNGVHRSRKLTHV